MGNFSFMAQKKYRDLNSEQQRIFIGEFERRKKSVGVAYLLWILGGWYYAYLKKLGWLILFLLTAGGLFIWAIIDLFRIPKLVEDYNNDLALEILRDISIMFPAHVNQSLDQTASEKSVNDHYIARKTQSGESYSFFIIIGIIVLLSISAFYFKPDRTQMQNKVVDEMMTNQPQLLKMMKDFFIGEKLNDEYSQNFILNTLSKNGYTNVVSYEEDFVLLRKLNFRDENSNEDVITAYGLFGFTNVFFNDIHLKEDNFLNNKIPKEQKNHQYRNTSFDLKESRPDLRKRSSTKNELKTINDPLDGAEVPSQTKKKTEPEEDSIKI